MRWLEDDPVLARAALLALAVGCAGNAYFLLVLSSATAFSAGALLFPAVAALCLAAIIVLVLGAAIAPGRAGRPQPAASPAADDSVALLVRKRGFSPSARALVSSMRGLLGVRAKSFGPL